LGWRWRGIDRRRFWRRPRPVEPREEEEEEEEEED
jgi:hypothetical protein